MTDTIAAVATPPGVGAIAIVRVSGPSAVTIAAQIFRPAAGGSVEQYRGYSVHYGAFAGRGEQPIDTGLLTLFRAPRTYTGEDMAELSCHGGGQCPALILELVAGLGARLAQPGEFTLRAFLNGRMDLAQAEAVADVIRSQTDAGLRLAQRQLAGGLSSRLEELRQKLIGALASIEASIDFSDEVGELDRAALAHGLCEVVDRIGLMLHEAHVGRLLREGAQVALLGRPNAGKSSLLNALLRSERAIVAPEPGTTRDTVEETVELRGIPVRLVDTAGLRPAPGAIEAEGIRRAQQAAETADLLLYVTDAATAWPSEDNQMLDRLPPAQDRPLIVAVNKWDTAPAGEVARHVVQHAGKRPDFLCAAPVSAVSGQGLQELEERIAQALGRGAAPPEDVLVANSRHRTALTETAESLQQAISTTRSPLPPDLISVDIRCALDALGRITGETASEEVIHRIFREFCVGK